MPFRHRPSATHPVSRPLLGQRLLLAGLALVALTVGARLGVGVLRSVRAAPITCPADLTISNIAVSNITANAARVSWRTNASSSSTLIILRTSLPDLIFTGGAGLSHNVEATGLSAATSYNFTVRSEAAPPPTCPPRQATGSGSFTTLDPSAPAAPVMTDVNHSVIASDQVRISWTTDIPASSVVRYGTSSSYGNVRQADGAEPADPTQYVTSHSITLTELSPDATYYYRVESTANGLTTISPEGDSFRTTASTENIITNINLKKLTAVFATITWNTSLPSNGRIEYGETRSLGNFKEVRDIFTPGHELDLDDLAPDRTYFYKIISVSSADTGSVRADSGAEPRQFHTPLASSEAPPVITDFTIERFYNSARITLTTDKPTHVTLKYGTTPGYELVPPKEDPPGVYLLTRVFTLTPLNAGTEYHTQARAVDSFGNETNSADRPFFTTLSPFDHFFDTGGCEDPVTHANIPIGGCSVPQPDYDNKQLFCDSGTLRLDCTKCNAFCAENQTCKAGGSCVDDPALSGNAFQCNKDECYNGQFFQNPAVPGCWRTWPRCSANVVLKVRRDRVCEQWMTCSASQEVTRPDTGLKEDICVGIAGCSSLGPNGICNQYLGSGQCSNDPLKFCNVDGDCNGGSCLLATTSDKTLKNVTYQTPQDVSKIQNLSGLIKAGLDWGTAGHFIEGMYPWFLMPQWGESFATEVNDRGDFEYPARSNGERGESTKLDPFGAPHEATAKVKLEEVPGSGRNNLNHVLAVMPDADATEAYIQTPASPLSLPVFSTLDYFAHFRLKTKDGDRPVWVQFASGTPLSFTTLARLSSTAGDLREYVLGPVKGLEKEAWLRFYFPPGICRGDPDQATACSDNAGCGAFADPECTVVAEEKEVWIDDVRITSGLEVRARQYVMPTCRLYPNGEAEACTYIDENGTKFIGQSGYCLERDPKNPAICLSWWPVDTIRGELNAFGSEKSAGFNTAGPVYYCLQNRMYSQAPTEFWAHYTYDASGNIVSNNTCIDAYGGCDRSECRDRALGWSQAYIDAQRLCPPGYHFVNQEQHDQGYRCGGACERGGAGDLCEYKCVLNAEGDPIADQIRSRYTESTSVSGTVSQCAVIAKVGDAGQNSAWAGRIQPDAPYKVGLGREFAVPPSPVYLDIGDPTKTRYPQSVATGFTLDYPFGRLVSPLDSGNPESWGSIQIRSTCSGLASDPLRCQTGNPGDAAGAVPYAWVSRATPTNARCFADNSVDPRNDARRDASCTAGYGRCVLPLSGTCSNNGAISCYMDSACRNGANNLRCNFTDDPATAGLDEAAGKCVKSDGALTTASCRLNRVCQNDPTRECSLTAVTGQLDVTCGGTCDPDLGGPGLSIACTGDAVCGADTCHPGATSICMPQDYPCNLHVDPADLASVAVACENRGGFNQCNTDRFVATSATSGFCSQPDGSLSASACSNNDDCNQYQFCREFQSVTSDIFGFERVEESSKCANADGSIANPDRTCVSDADCSRCVLPQLCNAAEDCYENYCKPETTVTGACSNNPATSCRNGTECYAAQPDHQTCTINGSCSGGANDGNPCQGDVMCRTQACKDVGSADPTEAPTDAACINIGALSVQSLNLAVERVKRIFAAQYGIWYWMDPDGAGGEQQRYVRCDGSGVCGAFASVPTYQSDPNFYGSWKVPSRRCPADGRPLPDNDDEDYCAIRPEAFNGRWKNGGNAISITRGESATLQFNTRADKEQKPLRRIMIDWTGLGTDIQPIPFPFDTRESATEPHTFRHPFFNNTTQPVTYYPRVLVMDNWEWCNNGENTAPCQTNPAQWPFLRDADGKRVEITVD